MGRRRGCTRRRRRCRHEQWRPRGCDPHTRPTASGLRQFDPEGARDRRRAARAAIEGLGSRPSCSNSVLDRIRRSQLYRAYLEQSDVFIGIYWQHYGWIAPGDEISGLEDEYRLTPRDMPKLIYLKQPAERRGSPRGAAEPDPRRRHRVVHALHEHADELAELIAGRSRNAARRAVRRVTPATGIRRRGGHRRARAPPGAVHRGRRARAGRRNPARRGSATRHSGSSRSWGPVVSGRAGSRSRSHVR